jgi:hypothetical protein
MTHARSVALVGAVVGALCLHPQRADADASKAWAAAKANLPSSTHVLVGMDVNALTRSPLFSMLFPLVVAQQPDFKEGLSVLEKVCQLNPMKAIDGLVVGMAKDKNQGAVFLSLNGVDEARLVGCIESIAQSKYSVEAKLRVTRAGGITELAMGPDAKVYVKWFGSDVVALPIDVGNKAQLEKWAGSKNGLAKARVGRVATKVDTRAALWAITGYDENIDGVRTSLGYGSFDIAQGKLSADLRIVTSSAKDAKTVATKAQADLQESARSLDPSLAALLGGVSIGASGPEIVIKASIPEKEVLSLLTAVIK